jgi:hypothetical protein
VTQDRFLGILRAGRIKAAARRQKRRNKRPVEPDGEQDDHACRAGGCADKPGSVHKLSRGAKAEQREKLIAHRAKRKRARLKATLRNYNVIASRTDAGLFQAEKFPYQSARPVAPNSRAAFPGNGHAQTPRQIRLFPPQRKNDKRAGKKASARRITTQKFFPISQTAFRSEFQTVNFLRPLARLRFKISRPAAVLMRARKPCVRLRLMRLGWYVLFMICLLHALWHNSKI